MDVLTITIVLLIVQFHGSVDFLQKDAWFSCWMQSSAKFALPRWLNLVLVIGLPCFCAFFLLCLVDSWFWGSIELLLNVCILAFALGRGEYNRYLYEYIDAWSTRDIQQVPLVLSQIDAHYSAVPDASPSRLKQDAREVFLVAAFKRWFVVLFWYLLLGPVVALLYRLVSLAISYYSSPDHEEGDIVITLNWVLFIMEWPMSRLMALCFVVSGQVSQVFGHWCQAVLNVNTDNTDFIVESADIALGVDEEAVEEADLSVDEVQDQAIQEAKDIKQLLNRCLILVLAFAFIIQIT